MSNLNPMRPLPIGQAAAGAPVNRDKKKSRTWLWIILGTTVVPVFIFLVVAVAAFIMAGSFMGVSPRGKGVDESPAVREVWSCGQGDIKVVRIPLKGVLFEEEARSIWSAKGPVEKALRHIRAATEDESVSAIIIEIDSPGGAITACDLIYNALMDFKNSSEDRVVVAILGDMAASGGYYVAAAADYIVAHPTTVTGSFGVIISSLNVKGLGDRYGVKLNTIKSGENKDIMSPFGEMTEEQKKLMQDVVDEMHERFVSLIIAGRPDADADRIRKIADGRLFSSKSAVEHKLVDCIGYWDDAVDAVAGLLGEGEVKVVKYGEEFSLAGFMEGRNSTPALSTRALLDAASPRILCIWPGSL